MRWQFWCILLGVLVTLGLATSDVAAQGSDTTCPALVQAALDAADSACNDIGRNQACYGNILIDAVGRPDATGFVFETSGDVVDVNDLESLTLAGMNVANDTWGVALMRLQANLPDTLPGQNVTFLLFGDVEITNAVEAADTTVVATSGNALALGQMVEGAISNERPSIEYTYTGTAGDVISVRMERTSGDLDTYVSVLDPTGNEIAAVDDDPQLGLAGSIVNSLTLPVDGTYTIVATRFGFEGGSSSGSFSLVVETGDAGYTAPMQAFYFRTGVGDAACAEAPESGMMVQTPEGVGEVQLLVNGVRFELASTAYLQATPGGVMTIALLEGTGRAESDGVARIIPGGSYVTVPIDMNMEASGPPSEPEPYGANQYAALPTKQLPEVIEVAPPASTEMLVRGDVRINLTWDSDADLDLYLVEPDGTTIFFGSPSSNSGALLDQDTNFVCEDNFGTEENITWPTGQPLLGTHTIQVRTWDLCSDGFANWTVTVTIGDTVVLQESGTGDADFTFER
jgi:hypothetical protein